jgi:hypothetical protein
MDPMKKCSDAPDANPTPEIGICVLTYNSEDVLQGCIQALKNALVGVPYEIVVVDNDSRDRSAAEAERQQGVKVIRNPRNTGYARGNNAGASQLLADGCKYIAFVNPDVIVKPDTFTNMRAALEDYEDAGCVGCVAVVNGRPFAGSFRTRPTLPEKLWVYSSMRHFPLIGKWMEVITRRMEAHHFLSLSFAQPVYALCGACIMFPSEAFAKVLGFDEMTFLYQEEFIMSERLRHAGYKVYGIPTAQYEHFQGHSAHADVVKSKSCFIESEQYYLRQYCHRGFFVRLLVRLFRWLDLRALTLHAFLKRRARPSDCHQPSSAS